MPAAAQNLIWRNPCLRPLRPKVGLRHKISAFLVWDPGCGVIMCRVKMNLGVCKFGNGCGTGVIAIC